MSEIAEFSNNPEFESLLQIRSWDETAKDPGKKTRSFADYAPLLEGLIDAQIAQGNCDEHTDLTFRSRG